MYSEAGNPFVPYKILRYLDRIIELRDTGKTWPVVLDLWVTDRCNHRCPHCIGFQTGAPDMPVELACKIVREFAEGGGKSICFAGGGEPLMYPHLLRVMCEAVANHLDIALITNGSIYKPEVAELMRDHGTWLRVSLDAYDEESHRKMHGVNSKFDEVLEVTRQYGETLKGSKCYMGVGYLVSEDTVAGIESIAQTCSELPIHYLQYRPLYGDFTDARAQIDETKKQYETPTFRVLNSTGKFERLNSCRKYGECYGHWFGAVVKTSGKFQLCCVEPREFGHASNGFAEEWYGSEREECVKDIKLEQCPKLCRWDSANELLWRCLRDATHPTFIA